MGILPAWMSWGLGFPLLVLNGWLLLQVVTYFQPLVNIMVIAMILSFLLDYPVMFLQSCGLARRRAIFWVFLLVLSLVAVLGVTLVPVILSQLVELANRLPNWLASGTRQLQALEAWGESHNLPLDVSGLTNQLTTRLSGELQTLTSQVLTLAFDTVGSVVNVVLTLVLALYLVLVGERLWTGLFSWVPNPLGGLIRPTLYRNFHNYFVGQATIAAILSVALSGAFIVLKVPFGLLFGLGIGIMALIPFGGIVSITVVSLLVALQDVWLGVRVLATALVFSQVNDQVIAPRILGDVVGLNPVWIILALLIGAKVAGVLGVFVAVPIAASIKSLADKLRPAAVTVPPNSATS